MNLSYVLSSLIYYITILLRQIAGFWLLGLLIGSILSAWGNRWLPGLAARIPQGRNPYLRLLLAACLGVLSPITLHGMIPILAALMQLNISPYIISAFMVSSVLLNPNVFIYSFALGTGVALLRAGLCILAGVGAGILTKLLGSSSLYDTRVFEKPIQPRSSKAFWHSLWHGLLKTAPNLALGILLAALFQVFASPDTFRFLFRSNPGLSVLCSASLGVPTYYCGGGTIPLVGAWMDEGMSLGAAMAYMLTGPATKFTNLTAVKILLPGRKLWLFIVYCISFAIITGLTLDAITGMLR